LVDVPLQTPARQHAHTAPIDPFQTLDDLMVVVEALCPEWPARPPLTRTKDWGL
jgi:hypothetical protein